MISAVRYPQNQKETTRQRIILAASRMFGERGYRATGVGAVMKAAGMTAGGFYAHFPSKEALFTESLPVAFRDLRKRLSAGTPRQSASACDLVRRYFDAPEGDGSNVCRPIPELASDVARSSNAVRGMFEQEVQKTAAAFAARLRGPKEEADETALALLALCAGGVLLSRAVKTPELADRIRKACLRFSE